jgi:hypothetical protein
MRRSDLIKFRNNMCEGVDITGFYTCVLYAELETKTTILLAGSPHSKGHAQAKRQCKISPGIKIKR